MNNKGELVLPSFFTENYFTLLPGDSRKIDLDYPAVVNKTPDDNLRLVIEGWNVPAQEIKF